MQAGLEADFFSFRCEQNGNNLCHCVAWWVPSWEGWGERSEAENRALREQLFAKGEYDGYLLYVDGQVAQKGLSPSPDTWAISCVEIAPRFRGRGCAKALLDGVLEDLRARGVKHVQAFPKRGEGLETGDVWTGPEALFRGAGFLVEKDHEKFPVLGLRLP